MLSKSWAALTSIYADHVEVLQWSEAACKFWDENDIAFPQFQLSG